ncbi:hypothetical protein GVAV_001736 [Gurleya vavrai]
MKLRIFYILVLFLGLFHISLSCNLNRERDTGNYVDISKYDSKKYIDQEKSLLDCLENIPDRILQKKQGYIDTYVDTAIKKIENELSEIDTQIFRKRKFFQCLEILGKHYVEEFLCNRGILEKLELELIEFYAFKEYGNCLDMKNNPYLREIEFDTPNIGFGAQFVVENEEFLV